MKMNFHATSPLHKCQQNIIPDILWKKIRTSSNSCSKWINWRRKQAFVQYHASCCGKIQKNINFGNFEFKIRILEEKNPFVAMFWTKYLFILSFWVIIKKILRNIWWTGWEIDENTLRNKIKYYKTFLNCWKLFRTFVYCHNDQKSLPKCLKNVQCKECKGKMSKGVFALSPPSWVIGLKTKVLTWTFSSI